jgi:tetratricopeptide (TPR) repeat protein
MVTFVHPLDADLLNPAALERARRAAQQAVQLDPNLPQGHGELGHVLLHSLEHDAAITAFERACMLNPNYIHWRHGTAVIFAGEPERAIEILKTQMIRDPFYPVHALSFLGFAYFVAKRYAEAIPPLLEAVARAPDFRPPRLFLAATYSRLGQYAEARVEAEHVRRLDPSWTISKSLKLLAPFKHSTDVGHFIESVRAAGLPE